MTLGPLMLDVAGPVLQPEEAEQLRHPQVGGVILFARNYTDREQLRRLTDAIRAARKPPVLIAVDQEGGRVQRFREGYFRLPPARWIGHQFDLDADRGRHLAHLCGWLMAVELLDDGVDFSFAPVVDLDYGVSEVIGDRAFHRDPDVVSTLALAWMQGMRKAGMAATAKHFPGHGHVVADSHLELPVDQRTYDEMYDDLAPFGRLIPHGLAGVMVAHVRYPQVEEGVASLSPWWIQTALRQNLGFRGVVFSDDLSMKALVGAGDVSLRVQLALAAGADMALVCNDPAAASAALDGLEGYSNPASQARLLTLRGHLSDAGFLRQSAEWRDAVATLEAALERPSLALDG